MDAYVQRFLELEFDASEFQEACTPGYFNNEGEKKPKWALFRAWGEGWHGFQKLVSDWREQGDMAGMVLED